MEESVAQKATVRPTVPKDMLTISHRWANMCFDELEGEEFDMFTAVCIGVCVGDIYYRGFEGFGNNRKLQDLFERTYIKKIDPSKGRPGHIGLKRRKEL